MTWSEKAIDAAYDAYYSEDNQYKYFSLNAVTFSKGLMRAALDAAAAVDGDAQWNAVIMALANIKELDSIKDDASMTVRLGPCGRIADAVLRSIKRG